MPKTSVFILGMMPIFSRGWIYELSLFSQENSLIIANFVFIEAIHPRGMDIHKRKNPDSSPALMSGRGATGTAMQMYEKIEL